MVQFPPRIKHIIRNKEEWGSDVCENCMLVAKPKTGSHEAKPKTAFYQCDDCGSLIHNYYLRKHNKPDLYQSGQGIIILNTVSEALIVVE